MTFEVVFLCLVGLVSLVAWGFLFSYYDWANWLKYEPRTSVPWGGGFGSFAILFVVLSFAAASSASDSDPPMIDADSLVGAALSNFATFMLFIGLAVFAIRLTTGATWRDFGLPTSVGQLMRDLRIGIVCWLLALGPVYLLQAVLVSVAGEGEPHPTLQMLTNSPALSVFIATLVLAAVTAPLVEEFLFRLLLQGWLEKVEDQIVGWHSMASSNELPSEHSDVRLAHEDSDNPFASPLTISTRSHSDAPVEGQQQRELLTSFGGLPHGWAPILGSALLFAVVHIGQNTAPVPLFLFAVILGYAYQRTHRITPTIFAHMAFNATSLSVVWLEGIYSG